MNQRIQELADRLWRIHPKDIDAMGLKTRKEFYEQELKKFAELIVRECANTLTIRASYYTSCSSDDPTTAEWFSGTVNGLKEGADLIKNHFGVEE